MNFAPVIAFLESWLQEENIDPKLPVVTAVAFKAGTAWSEEQLTNILNIFVTAAVLNNGTDWSDEQL